MGTATPPAPELPTDDAVVELLRSVYDWAAPRPLAALLPRESLPHPGPAELERLRPSFERWWSVGLEAWAGDPRTVAELLGPSVTAQVLRAVQESDPDLETVRVLFQSQAVASMLGVVLYDGIREFLRRVDVLGPVIDKLPLLGPLRRRVLATIQNELEGPLEGQIKAFLGGFSGAAVDLAIAYATAPANREGFRESRRRLVEHLLSRPVANFAPPPPRAEAWRERVWQAALEASADAGLRERWLDELYGRLGGLELREVLPTPPPEAWLRALAGPLREFLATAPARAWFAQHLGGGALPSTP